MTKVIFTIFNIIFMLVGTLTMTSVGYGPTTWQWWLVLISTMMCHLMGFFYGIS